ncbi:MAG TPA: LPP20 family lipoprotein [Gammaproteobacteria bacterium]|nr:LPP20 family lipoprotein [Gammaproteobacteria bacterium]
MKYTPIIQYSGILCTLCLLAACASTPQQPDWVLGTSNAYPAQGWLTGHGSADTRAEAENRARAEIAKVFAVRIQAQSHDEQRYIAVDGEAQSQQAITRQINTSTDEILHGAQIAETWQNPRTGVWHALAVLSRARASQGLRQKIASLDAATRGFLQNRAPETGDAAIFRQLALLDKAITLQKARAGLNQRLQAVDATGRGVPVTWSVGELQAQQQALLGKLVIAPQGAGEHADSLRAMLGAALSRAGLQVAPTASYQMLARLNYNTLPQQGEWHWVRGVLQVEVTDQQGISYGVRRWEIKQSATDAATAERRFVSEVAKILDEQAAATLIDLATPQE